MLHTDTTQIEMTSYGVGNLYRPALVFPGQGYIVYKPSLRKSEELSSF